VPAFALKAALGSEVAEEMLLVSQRVTPKKLLDAGHTFRTPTLEETLRHVLGRSA
jgi:NAD dependent epimerase/dehydratase family enzyme